MTDQKSPVEVTTFDRVPEFAYGLVRDIRVRWACEEVGVPYVVRRLDTAVFPTSDYLSQQPFAQIPTLSDGEIQMFESGAIAIHIAQKGDGLLPPDVVGRARAVTWVFAALNTIEPLVGNIAALDFFLQDQTWSSDARPVFDEFAQSKLKRLSDWLSDRPWLEDRFTVGDLMMVSVLRNVRHCDTVTRHPNLADYVARAEARPAFQRALASQIADFQS